MPAGFDAIRPTAQAAPAEAEGMLARRKRELEDAMRSIAGTGVGAGGGGATGGPGGGADMYQDITGKWHHKGSLE